MDQPLVNLNEYPNSIEENPQVQRNIYNQGQYQPNQQNTPPPPPEQPFYLSSSNTNTPNEKPIKSQQNKANHSSQINFQYNYLPPNEGVFNTQPDNNIETQKYNNFSEIPHERISHPNEKTFNISIPPIRCYKCGPLF